MQGFDHISGSFLKIADANIYYEVQGDQTKPALLFLHGGFGNMEDFNEVIAALPDEFMLIGMDSRGQGKSTLGKQPLSYELLQQDVEKLLAHLHINTLTIIGFSDGGIIGYRLAALTDLKIQKLITIGSRWHTKNITPRREKMQHFNGDVWRIKYPWHYESYQRLNAEPDFNKLTLLLIKMWIDETSHSCANERVKNITCPILAARGELDPFISDADLRELATLVPSLSVLNIPDALHVAHKEQPEFFIEGLKEFLFNRQ